MQFVDLKAQYLAYQAEIDVAVKAVLNSTQFINGPQVEALEEGLADFVGVKHAVACASGTDALQMALMVLGIGPGDEVITTPFTFIATAETIVLTGARPVFVDIEEQTYNLDPAALEAAVSPATRAIIAVDLYGHPAAYPEIEKVAARHGLKLIEDAAQALGGARLGRNCGSFGDLAATSFFPSKPLGCYGDGGMLFTAEAEFAEKLRSLRNHGQKQRYYHEMIGCNSRLDTLQAAILLAKLPYFPEEISRRINIASRYSQALSEHFITPTVADGCVSVFAQYSLRSARRDEVVAALAAAGIPSAVHYPIPLHLQPAFADLGYRAGDFPVAEKIATEIFSLPMHPFLTVAEQDRIIAVLLKAL
ncbi:MAG: DegT/DnrJ/EryC1/StrS family aminotransferase [Deltaproteobacteria bacterium]|nr:DegT/DnrJ/EryC1/StrS family aminotransferase [Deltaproteobacteria bacterium]